MPTRFPLVPALAGAVFALAFSAAPAPAHAEPPAASSVPARDRFAGQFVFAGGETQRAQLEAAIDRAIDGMFFAAKPIARSKLRDKTEIKQVIGFAFANAAITSTASEVAPATSPDDGSFAAYVGAGEKLKLSQKILANGHLVQTFAAAEGTRTNEYVLSADGRQLSVAVIVSSSRLPRAVKYVLSYQRH